MRIDRSKGFTLSERLVSLAILGVIATFTIPKVLQAQQSKQFNTTGQELAAMLSSALEAYRYEEGLSATTSIQDLTPYINYIAIDTSTQIDDLEGSGALNCSGGTCLRFHNGGMILFYNVQFGGTSN